MIFSRRLDLDLCFDAFEEDLGEGENLLSRATAARRRGGAPIIDLTVSNPTAVGLSVPDAALAESLGGPGIGQYVPAPLGLPVTRRAVADHCAEHGVVIDPDDVVVTASSSESYAFLFKLFCDPGSGVAVPQPGYPLFESLASLDAARVSYYQLAFDGAWSIDFDSLDAAMNADCRAVIAVSPNNPTGSYLRSGDLERLANMCAARALPLIVDEVFADYPLFPREDAVPRVAGRDLPCAAFVLGGLSKSCGLPQLKLGWMLMRGPTEIRRAARRRLEAIADNYLSVSSPVALGLPGFLEQGRRNRAAIAARIADNHAGLKNALAETGASLLPVEAGWSAVVRVPEVKTDEQWALDLLKSHGLLVQPGYLFDFGVHQPGQHLVISLLGDPEAFAQGMAILRAAVVSA